MVHHEYICDACGYSSEEERGVYNCPKCGNQMRIARTGTYSGDTSITVGRWLVTIICFFILLFLGVLFLGPFGIILAFIITFFIWRFFKKAAQDNAIPANTIRNPNRVYSCNSCGGRFKGQQPSCPHCGVRLRYKN